MLNGRQTAILRKLMSQQGYITGEKLAVEVQVSSRTIRTDMKELATILESHGGTVKSARGLGYILEIMEEQPFRQFLQETILKPQAVSVNLSVPEERTKYIVKRLLLEESFLKMEDLADEMFISKSTLQNDLSDAKRIFKKFGIKIMKRPNYGLKVQGSELQLRFCMSEHLFERKLFADSALPDDEQLIIIKDMIIRQIDAYHITLSDIALNNLVIHISIAIQRIKDGNYVSLSDAEIKKVTGHKEYKVASVIIEELSAKLEIPFPQSEIVYVAIHLLGTKIIENGHEQENGEILSYLDASIFNLTKKILSRIDEKLGLMIQFDHELTAALSLHLKPAINRFQYQMNLRNPILDQVKEHYPLAFEAGIIAAQVIAEEMQLLINDDEVGYLAIHIGAAIERSNLEKKPPRCLIVCASGVGSAMLLSSKLKATYGSKIEIGGTSEYYKLKDIDLLSYDFVISTIPIKETLPIPAIVMDTFLGPLDYKRIDGFLGNQKYPALTYVQKELVFLRESFQTMEEILRFLCKKIEEQGFAEEGFLESVMKREGFSSTAFGNLVAIPHPEVPVTEKTFWSICTLQKPIKWGSHKVQFICLLCVERDSGGDFRDMYELLGSIVNDREKVERLLKCRSFEELVHIIK